MKQKPDYKVVGRAFIAICVVIAAILYAIIRTPTAPAQPAIENASVSNAAMPMPADNAAPVDDTAAASPSDNIEAPSGAPSPEDICSARILRDVAAADNPDAKMKAGEIWRDVTQFWQNKRTGETRFCAHGDYCFPARTTVDGQTVDTIKLLNCVVRDRGGEEDENGDYLFSVERP